MFTVEFKKFKKLIDKMEKVFLGVTEDIIVTVTSNDDGDILMRFRAIKFSIYVSFRVKRSVKSILPFLLSELSEIIEEYEYQIEEDAVITESELSENTVTFFDKGHQLNDNDMCGYVMCGEWDAYEYSYTSYPFIDIESLCNESNLVSLEVLADANRAIKENKKSYYIKENSYCYFKDKLAFIQGNVIETSIETGIDVEGVATEEMIEKSVKFADKDYANILKLKNERIAITVPFEDMLITTMSHELLKNNKKLDMSSFKQVIAMNFNDNFKLLQKTLTFLFFKDIYNNGVSATIRDLIKEDGSGPNLCIRTVDHHEEKMPISVINTGKALALSMTMDRKHTTTFFSRMGNIDYKVLSSKKRRKGAILGKTGTVTKVMYLDSLSIM